MHFQPDNTYSGLLCVVHCLSASLSSNHSVQFSRSVVSDSPQPHELKHARPPSITNCQRSLKLMSIESLIPSTHLILCRPLLLPPSIFPRIRVFVFLCFFFQMSQLSTSGGQSIRVSASASVLPVNTQDWSPLGWTGWISSLCKGLSRVFSNTTVEKHQFFSAQISSQSNLTKYQYVYHSKDSGKI